MEQQLQTLKEHVKQMASDPSFVHHGWFVQWHLELVERIALELAGRYTLADRDMIVAMAWLHDYGKIINFERQYDRVYIDAGRDKLIELGFNEVFANAVADNIERADQKTELSQANIEVQIVSSADGCSHLVGPFTRLYWWEHPEMPFDQIMSENIRKLSVDWELKVVLPEAKHAFQARYDVAMEQAGVLPKKFIV